VVGVIVTLLIIWLVNDGCRAFVGKSVKVFNVIHDIFKGAYCLTMLVWFVVEWVRSGFGTAFGVMVIMGIPLFIFSFVFGEAEGGWTRREWKDGAPNTLD